MDQHVRRVARGATLAAIIVFTSMSCGGDGNAVVGSDPGNPPPTPSASFTGVLMWKGNASGNGSYSSETALTPANVNVAQFGKVGGFDADGLLVAQPLYVSNVDMGSAGKRNIIVLATEHDSVYAIDADNPGSGPLWARHYLDASAGIAPLPDNFGGRTTLGGEVGITGTPLVDPASGVLYFVTALSRNGTAEQWLRSIDIRTGSDVGPGSVQIQASVPGDGKGTVNGQIPFNPAIQNQRAGLTKVNGSILVPWGSFSDYGVYHGWLIAFDPSSLAQQAVFNPTTQAQPNDVVDGPADHGGGGAFWQGGAAPSVDSGGNIYLNAADGSFNADEGGNNYGDTLLKLRLSGNSFQIVDWFTPFNQACIDSADLELGSGGVALLPSEVSSSQSLAAVISKEGRLILVNRSNLGKFNAISDSQIPQEIVVGQSTCTTGMGNAEAEGTGWNRLYGNPSYWNGNIYVQAANMALKQYRFQNGLLGTTPVAQSPTASGLRGANTVVSSNGNQSGIVWAYEKSDAGRAILHAYDANAVSTELWNSNMNAGRDQLGTGIAFATPVIADGKVVVTFDHSVAIYGLLQ